MLTWVLPFLVVALVAAALRFVGSVSAAMRIARILFLVFTVAFVISPLTGRRSGPRIRFA